MTKYAQPILFFYCYACKDYELKTCPHFAEQKARFAERRKAEAAQDSQDKEEGPAEGLENRARSAAALMVDHRR
jgi:hypothetical protein